MSRAELVVVGGGLTAARAVGSYREAGGAGRIVLVSEEASLPYHRPALSKGYLRGETEETPYVEDAAFYRDNDVDVWLETAVTSVDPGARAVTLDDRTRLAYEKLLIATGAAPRRLRVDGADLRGVFTLRRVGDSAAIRDAAATSTRAVVIGGGFIGMETAASLRQLGLDVTLVHMGSGLFDQLRSTGLSQELLSLYRERGIDVLLDEEVTRFGGDGHVEYVETKSGLRIGCDLAVVGIGVAPNVEFLAGSGIPTEDGVVVNERFESVVADVYAAGDVARFFDPLYGGGRRIEHWSNANYQGTEVGKVIAGEAGAYDVVSSFFSEIFATTIKVFGETTRFDEIREEGSLREGFLAAYGERGRLVGAITVAQSEDFEGLVKDLIAARAPVEALDRQLVTANVA